MSTSTDDVHAKTERAAAPLLPGVNTLTAADYAELLRDVAEVYDRFYLSDAERAEGNHMATAANVRQLADALSTLAAQRGAELAMLRAAANLLAELSTGARETAGASGRSAELIARYLAKLEEDRTRG